MATYKVKVKFGSTWTTATEVDYTQQQINTGKSFMLLENKGGLILAHHNNRTDGCWTGEYLTESDIELVKPVVAKGDYDEVRPIAEKLHIV